MSAINIENRNRSETKCETNRFSLGRRSSGQGGGCKTKRNQAWNQGLLLGFPFISWCRPVIYYSIIKEPDAPTSGQEEGLTTSARHVPRQWQSRTLRTGITIKGVYARPWHENSGIFTNVVHFSHQHRKPHVKWISSLSDSDRLEIHLTLGFRCWWLTWKPKTKSQLNF